MTIEQLSNLIKDPNLFGILIVRPFGLILLSLYNFVHNYGLAVILFALIVKLCCVPLAIKGKKSMLAMTALNAEMQQLQKKYANNQPLQYIVGLSSETVIKLAQLVGLDNLAGANYTVQIVIAEKLNAFKDAAGQFAPEVLKCLGDGESIFPMDFNFFGLNLADTPSIKHPGLIWIIPILSGLTAYLSSYIMQKMQKMPQGNDAAAKQMKMMTMLMPLMSLYFAFILPGAIGIYWIFNNVFTCVQEIILTKHIRGKQEAKQAAEAERVEAEKKAKREANRAAQKSRSEKKKGDK